jgi:DNA invertase Pin-like site-specific DNA recombinase
MTEPAIRELRQAVKRRDRADEALREAREQLRERVREAQAAGVPVTRIAAELGVSRQAVYDALAAAPPS